MIPKIVKTITEDKQLRTLLIKTIFPDCVSYCRSWSPFVSLCLCTQLESSVRLYIFTFGMVPASMLQAHCCSSSSFCSVPPSAKFTPHRNSMGQRQSLTISMSYHIFYSLLPYFLWDFTASCPAQNITKVGCNADSALLSTNTVLLAQTG